MRYMPAADRTEAMSFLSDQDSCRAKSMLVLQFDFHFTLPHIISVCLETKDFFFKHIPF